MALLLVGFLAIGPTLVDHPKHEIDALNDQWVAAFKAGDYATIESLMAPDALLLALDAPERLFVCALSWLPRREGRAAGFTLI